MEQTPFLLKLQQRRKGQTSGKRAHEGNERAKIDYIDIDILII